uniref:Ig-like domain-containing protein n=1 Tax=Schistocephalus solidus TaxID=70667 RepID=A0A0X3PN55_SCHSO
MPYRNLLIVVLTLTGHFLDVCGAVKGCVTFVDGDDYNARHSICDKTDTHFSRIPETLPKEVVKLTVNNQNIPVLDGKQLAHLPNLTYLNLDSNRLRVIHRDAFHSVPFLRSLSLRNNQLVLSAQSFNPGALIDMNYLEELNLMKNPLGRVPSHFFYPVRKSLRTLVLAGATQDFNLSLDSLEGLFEIEFLDISYNRLHTLSDAFSGLFSTMKLKKLYLFGNPWHCDCSLRWLRQWAQEHNDTQFYVDLRHTEMGHLIDVGQVDGNPGVLSMETTNQPRCETPAHLSGRSFFPISGLPNNPVTSSEMACPPKPLSKSSNVRAKVGENVTVSCVFEALSVDEIFWYKNGYPLSSSHNVRARQAQGNKFFVDLVFQKLQQSDVGTYVCLIKNGFGKANATVTLTLSDVSWLDGLQSDSSASVSDWISKFDTNVVLKYTAIVAIGLVTLLVVVGSLSYCLFGRLCRRLKPMQRVRGAANAREKYSFSESPINRLQITDRRDSFSTASKLGLENGTIQNKEGKHQPCILRFQDSHPVYNTANSGKKEVDILNCPIHGHPGSSPAILPAPDLALTETLDDPYTQFETLDISAYTDRSAAHQTSQDKKDFHLQCSDYGVKLLTLKDSTHNGQFLGPTFHPHEPLNPPAQSPPPSVMLIEGVSSRFETPGTTRAVVSPLEYLSCPRHGNLIAALSPPVAHASVATSETVTQVPESRESTLGTMVRSVQNIRLSTPLGTTSSKAADGPRSGSLKSGRKLTTSTGTSTIKRVEFAEPDQPGFITTV